MKRSRKTKAELVALLKNQDESLDKMMDRLKEGYEREGGLLKALEVAACTLKDVSEVVTGYFEIYPIIPNSGEKATDAAKILNGIQERASYELKRLSANKVRRECEMRRGWRDC